MFATYQYRNEESRVNGRHTIGQPENQIMEDNENHKSHFDYENFFYEVQGLIKTVPNPPELPTEIKVSKKITQSFVANPLETDIETENVIRLQYATIIESQYSVKSADLWLRHLSNTKSKIEGINEINEEKKRAANIFDYVILLIMAILCFCLFLVTFVTSAYVFVAIGFDPPLNYYLPSVIVAAAILPKALTVYLNRKLLENVIVFILAVIAFILTGGWLYYFARIPVFGSFTSILEGQDLPSFFYGLQLVTEIVDSTLLTFCIGHLLSDRRWFTWFKRSGDLNYKIGILMNSIHLKEVDWIDYKDRLLKCIAAVGDDAVADFKLIKMGINSLKER